MSYVSLYNTFRETYKNNYSKFNNIQTDTWIKTAKSAYEAYFKVTDTATVGGNYTLPTEITVADKNKNPLFTITINSNDYISQDGTYVPDSLTFKNTDGDTIVSIDVTYSENSTSIAEIVQYGYDVTSRIVFTSNGYEIYSGADLLATFNNKDQFGQGYNGISSLDDLLTDPRTNNYSSLLESGNFNETRYAYSNTTLDDNDYVKNLTLIGSSINGTGNSANNTITGTTSNNILDGGDGSDTLIGGKGNDTYIIDIGDTITENSNEGTDTIKTSINYSLIDNVENLIVTDSDGIEATGNALNNIITGNSGNDTINGGTGKDSLVGGSGDDEYYIDNTGDKIVEKIASSITGGIDTVYSSISYTLGNNVENLVLDGTSNINGIGNALANTITGDDNNNTLDGKTGTDTLIGADGNDTYYIDNTGDSITENIDEGTDTVISSVNFTLDDNIENLTLTNAAKIGFGNIENNSITGNALANTLSANDGDDTLNGGAGADTLIGGIGDDIYYRDNKGDIISEDADGGTDTVISSLAYTLLDNFENLTFLGAASINGTGNNSNNTITGNTGNNILDGKEGSDTLIGGKGNDTYVIDDENDVITENSNEGVDIVNSNVSYSLSANIEKLTLTETDNINAIGNASNNTIIGNSGDNTITGATGNDSLAGGTGNDTYVFTNGDGTDIVNDTSTGNIIDLSNADFYNDEFGDNIEVSGSDLVINYSDTDSVTIKNQFTKGTVTQVKFAEGGLITIDEIKLGSAKSETLTSSTANYIYGGAGNDTITTNTDGACIDGGFGTDSIIGGTGNDILFGGSGNNTNDTIQGDAGDDEYYSAGSGTKTYLDTSGNDEYGFYTGDSNTTNITDNTGNDTIGIDDTYRNGPNNYTGAASGEFALYFDDSADGVEDNSIGDLSIGYRWNDGSYKNNIVIKGYDAKDVTTGTQNIETINYVCTDDTYILNEAGINSVIAAIAAYDAAEITSIADVYTALKNEGDTSVADALNAAFGIN